MEGVETTGQDKATRKPQLRVQLDCLEEEIKRGEGLQAEIRERLGGILRTCAHPESAVVVDEKKSPGLTPYAEEIRTKVLQIRKINEVWVDIKNGIEV